MHLICLFIPMSHIKEYVCSNKVINKMRTRYRTLASLQQFSNKLLNTCFITETSNNNQWNKQNHF